MLVYTSCIQDLDWTGLWGGAYVSLYKLYTGPGLDSGGGGGVLMLVYTSCIQDLDWTLGWWV